MKIKSLVCLAVAGAVLALASQRAGGAVVGDTNGTRINDWNFSGCNDSPGAAGAPASGDNGAGGNQAGCATCPNDGGMPRWSVDEPNINLHVSDTPLEYTTSSGQKLSFRLFYKQRYLVPPVDQCPTCQGVNNAEEDAFGMHSMGLANASWNHNWMMDMQFWDNHWETNEPGGEGSGFERTAPIYSDSYEAMVFNPNGAVDYFYDNLNSGSYLGDPQRQNSLQALSGLGYPTVSYYGPTADTNGIYWGAPASDLSGVYTTNGFRIVYPDGSQDIFALAYYTVTYPAPTGDTPGFSRAHAFLTQRIDPAGRVTKLGYEQVFFTNPWHTSTFYYTFRLKYLVDSDGRTNTFYYNNSGYEHYPWELQEIDDPYGRKATFTQDDLSGNSRLLSITDAETNTTTFGYSTFQSTNTWLNSITTPYGTTSFIFYEKIGDTNIPFSFAQRATYVSEPDGAQQLFLFDHSNSNGVAGTLTAPTISGQSKFDDGTSTNAGSGVYALTYRNTFHWGRRQFAALSSNVVTQIGYGNLTNAINDLTGADFTKAHLSHWLLQADSGGYVTDDGVSLSELISLERDPSPDTGGTISGAWTWYNYANKYYGKEETGDSQINCVAQILPNGQVQYTRYNYNFGTTPPLGGLVSDNETSVTLTNGTVGELTNWFNYAYNAIDLTSTSNQLGHYVNYGYNSNHQLIAATNGANQVVTFGYDGTTHNLISNGLPNGRIIYLNHYAATNPTSSTNALLQQIDLEPEGSLVNFVDYTYNLPRIVHISGTGVPDLWLTNFWDGLNRRTGIAFQDGSAISNLYTILDWTAHQDRLGNWSYAGYDALEHLTSLTNANQAVTTFTWCGCGALTSVTDALTNTTYLNYDNQGRFTNKYFPDGTSITYQFDLNGRRTNLFDGSSRSLQTAYNVQGLPTNWSNAYGPLAQVVYDLVNRPAKITDANGVTTTNGYDSINRLLARVWTADGIGEYFAYATNGLIVYTNRNGKATLFGRDGAGRLTSITNANQQVTQFHLDALSRLTNLLDGSSNVTGWNFNQYGWATNKVDASNHQAFAFYYNANGWVTNRWSPASTNTTYSYDAVGNVTNITYPGSQTASVQYSYDALNRLTNMVDAVGTTTFTYTPTGQLLSETGPWTSNTATYAYTQGHRTSLTLSQPTGGSWTNIYGYDNEWRMTNVTALSGSFIYGYSGSASPLIQSLALPNAAYITYQYDSLARLTNTSLVNYWGHVLDGYGYGYDALGQRTNVTRNLGLTTNSVNIGYDNIGQLTSWNGKETNGTLRLNEQLDYGFDAAGNLMARTNGVLVQTFHVDKLNQLTNVARAGTFTFTGATPAPASNVTVNGNPAQMYGDFTFASTNLTLTNGSNTFITVATNLYGAATTNIFSVNLPTNVVLQYDANGSLTNDGAKSLFYDAENQLTNATIPGVAKTEFVYDGLGRKRIARDYTWAGSAWLRTNETRYIYDGMLVIQERDSNNVVQVTYTRGLDMSLALQRAGGIGGLLARTDTNGSVFYHSDGSGNTTALIDANQNIVARYEYDAFGRLILKSGAMADINRYRFSSKEYLPIPDEYDLILRKYSTTLQRFTSQDPIGIRGGVNLYRFAGNNPLSHFDPFGLRPGSEAGETGFSPFVPDEVVERDMELEREASTFGAAPKESPDEEWLDQLEAELAAADAAAAQEQADQAEQQKADQVDQAIYDAAQVKQVDCPVSSGPSPQEGIATPYGTAVQSMTPEAQAALREIENGATLYRQGQFGVQNTSDAQFWSLNNPATTPNYAGQMGMPAGSTTPDWIMGGAVEPGTPVITRPAPAGPGGVNLGGNTEGVVNPGGVQINWYHMP